MKNSYSIKTKLFSVVTMITLLLAAVVICFEIYNYSQLRAKITSQASDQLRRYSEQKIDAEVKKQQRDFAFFLQLMADNLALELYNYDKTSITTKLKQLVSHERICALNVIDRLSNRSFAKVSKTPPCSSEGTVMKTIAITHAGEKLGSLRVTHNYKPIIETIDSHKQLMEQYGKSIQDKSSGALWH